MFVIDDSGSMSGNDPGKKRLSVARDLIGRFPDGARTGIVRFADNQTDLTGVLQDAGTAISALSDLNFHNLGGTNMYKGLQKALDMFEGEDDTTLRTIIVLSDGETYDANLHDTVVAAANKRKVKINTVGLGGGGPGGSFEQRMKMLASQTGGESYHSQDADALSGIYDNIGKLIDIETDSDGDGIADWYEGHLVLFNGVSLTLDKDNPDTDGDGIPDGEEIDSLDYRYNADHTKVIVTGRLITDPTSADSDGDDISDEDESDFKTNPMNPDSDSDRLDDGDEVRRNFDPLSPNPDGDGRRDDAEVANGSSPYVYDKEWEERFACFVTGMIAGDFISDDDDAATLAGQVINGVIPFSDIRDVVANTMHHDYYLAALSGAGALPVVGDVTKATAKVGKFILRNVDDPAKAATLLGILEKRCPSLIAKLSGSDEFIQAATQFNQRGYLRLTKDEKRHLVEAFKQAGLSDSLVTSSRDLPIKETVDIGGGIWDEPCMKRGSIIDESLNGHSAGRGLGRTFPVADRLEDRKLVSTKSLDLDANSYQNPSALKRKLEKYIADLEGFEDKYLKKVDDNGNRYRPTQGGENKFTEDLYDFKVLEVVFPDTPITDKVAETLRVLHDTHAGLSVHGVQIVFKIAK